MYLLRNDLSLRHLLRSPRRPIHGLYRPRQTLMEPQHQPRLRPQGVIPGSWRRPLLIQHQSQQRQLLLEVPLRHQLHLEPLPPPYHKQFQHSYMLPSRSVYGRIAFHFANQVVPKQSTNTRSCRLSRSPTLNLSLMASSTSREHQSLSPTSNLSGSRTPLGMLRLLLQSK